MYTSLVPSRGTIKRKKLFNKGLKAITGWYLVEPFARMQSNPFHIVVEFILALRNLYAYVSLQCYV